MHKRKSLCFLKNNKGMTILQFILMLLLVFALLAVFIEIGAILRSEAFVINSAVKLGKNLQSTGNLNGPLVSVSKEQSTLTGLGITNFNVQVTPSGTLTFRQNFTLVATADYKFNFGGYLVGLNVISIPLRITIKGKSEHFP